MKKSIFLLLSISLSIAAASQSIDCSSETSSQQMKDSLIARGFLSFNTRIVLDKNEDRFKDSTYSVKITVDDRIDYPLEMEGLGVVNFTKIMTSKRRIASKGCDDFIEFLNYYDQNDDVSWIHLINSKDSEIEGVAFFGSRPFSYEVIGVNEDANPTIFHIYIDGFLKEDVLAKESIKIAKQCPQKDCILRFYDLREFDLLFNDQKLNSDEYKILAEKYIGEFTKGVYKSYPLRRD